MLLTVDTTEAVEAIAEAQEIFRRLQKIPGFSALIFKTLFRIF